MHVKAIRLHSRSRVETVLAFLMILFHDSANLRPVLALVNHAYPRGSHSESAILVLLYARRLQSSVSGTQEYLAQEIEAVVRVVECAVPGRTIGIGVIVVAKIGTEFDRAGFGLYSKYSVEIDIVSESIGCH